VPTPHDRSVAGWAARWTADAEHRALEADLGVVDAAAADAAVGRGAWARVTI
jgi:hypothetical protein